MNPWEAMQRYNAKEARLVVGLMSGTSLDGIDAVLVRISGSGRATTATEEGFVSIPFPRTVRDRLLAICHGQGNAEEVSRLNFVLGDLFAEAIGAVLAKGEIAPSAVDLIASHGQTVSHCAPEATLQIGESSVIALRFGVPVVSDFRTADVAAGGQGAPLVPYADWCLFTHPRKSRVIQNIGGIGNLTYLPADASLQEVTGFDTGPGNMLIDRATHWVTGGLQLCDLDGLLGAAGLIDADLLEKLMTDPFLAKLPPKSAGREDFGEQFFDTLRYAYSARSSDHVQSTLVATMTAFTAESIAESYKRFLPTMPDEIIVGGGGARNPTLMRMLRERLPSVPIYTHEHLGMNGDSKEAVAFAILANETVMGKTSNVPSVTGASRRVILGKVTLPPE